MLRANGLALDDIVIADGPDALERADRALRNRGDRYVAFVDARCVLLPGWLDTLVHALERNALAAFATFAPSGADARATVVAAARIPACERLDAFETLHGSLADFVLRVARDRERGIVRARGRAADAAAAGRRRRVPAALRLRAGRSDDHDERRGAALPRHRQHRDAVVERRGVHPARGGVDPRRDALSARDHRGRQRLGRADPARAGVARRRARRARRLQRAQPRLRRRDERRDGARARRRRGDLEQRRDRDRRLARRHDRRDGDRAAPSAARRRAAIRSPASRSSRCRTRTTSRCTATPPSAAARCAAAATSRTASSASACASTAR